MRYNLSLNDLDYINRLAKYYSVKMRNEGFFVEYEEVFSEFNLIAVECLSTFDPRIASFKSYFSQVAKRHMIKKKDYIVKTI